MIKSAKATMQIDGVNIPTLATPWQPDLPVSDEVDQAMQELAEEVEAEFSFFENGHLKSDSDSEPPWFLIEQAY